MKVFRVTTERDGDTTKEPGKTTTEIKRESLLFAAETIGRVWVAIDWIRQDPDLTIVEIAEVAPAIHLVRDK